MEFFDKICEYLVDNLEFTFVPFAEIHEVEVCQFDQDVSKLSLNVDFLVF